MTSERELEALAERADTLWKVTGNDDAHYIAAELRELARRLQPARVPEEYAERVLSEYVRIQIAEHDERSDKRDRVDAMRRALAAAPAAERGQPEPIRMVLHCPRCHVQHIDEPDERTPGWNNPPHRSHLCHACGCIWRPADVPTMGVASIETRGKADTWSPANPAPESREAGQREGVEA